MTAVDLQRLAAFDRIDLQALNRTAALLDRMETKYLVAADAFSAMTPELARRCRILGIDDRVAFTYDTTYFDTPCLAAYRDHAQDRRRRFKVRSRCYVDAATCFVEVKLKGARGRTIKERLPYTVTDHGSLTSAARRFIDDVFGRVYGEPLRADLVAQLAMRYRRVTLVGRDAPERATIDFDLRFRRADGTWTAAPSDFVIVEVKSPRGRGVADEVLRGNGERPVGCSKYCMGLNVVHPGLPNNTFRRTLRRHFGWDTEAAGAADQTAPPPTAADGRATRRTRSRSRAAT